MQKLEMENRISELTVKEVLEGELTRCLSEQTMEDSNGLRVAFSYRDTWRIVVFRRYALYKGPKKLGYGRLASIGAHVDYHSALYAHLERVVTHLETCFGPQPRDYYVDKDGGDDREWAYGTGTCSYGKNHLIIHQDLGSAINIGSATVQIPDEVSQIWLKSRVPTLESICGNCSSCIAACPTQALAEGLNLNKNRCRSAINQKKGILDTLESSYLQDWLYGCDECLWACPYNAQSLVQEGLYMPLNALEGLTNRTFREDYGHRAFAYLGLTRLKRNINCASEWFKNKSVFE